MRFHIPSNIDISVGSYMLCEGLHLVTHSLSEKGKEIIFLFKKSVKVLCTYVDLSTLSLYYIILVKKWTPWGIRVCGGGGGDKRASGYDRVL